METLKDICKKDGRYKEVLKECYVVKNAVSLLGGRRKEEGEKEGEGRKGKEEFEEEKGGMENKEEEMEKKMEKKKKRETAEGQIERLKKEMEEMRKEELHTPLPSNTPAITPIESPVITSLDEIVVIFPGIKREGNTIIHHRSNSYRNCFIGGVMTSV